MMNSTLQRERQLLNVSTFVNNVSALQSLDDGTKVSNVCESAWVHYFK